MGRFHAFTPLSVHAYCMPAFSSNAVPSWLLWNDPFLFFAPPLPHAFALLLLEAAMTPARKKWAKERRQSWETHREREQVENKEKRKREKQEREKAQREKWEECDEMFRASFRCIGNAVVFALCGVFSCVFRWFLQPSVSHCLWLTRLLSCSLVLRCFSIPVFSFPHVETVECSSLLTPSSDWFSRLFSHSVVAFPHCCLSSYEFSIHIHTSLRAMCICTFSCLWSSIWHLPLLPIFWRLFSLHSLVSSTICFTVSLLSILV